MVTQDYIDMIGIFYNYVETVRTEDFCLIMAVFVKVLYLWRFEIVKTRKSFSVHAKLNNFTFMKMFSAKFAFYLG